MQNPIKAINLLSKELPLEIGIDNKFSGPEILNLPSFPVLSELKYMHPSKLTEFYKEQKIKPETRHLNNFLNIEFHAIFSYSLLFVRYNNPIMHNHKFLNGALEILKQEISHFEMLNNILKEDSMEFSMFPVNDNILKDLCKCDNIRDHFAMISLTHEAKAIDSKPSILPKLAQFKNKRLYETIEIILKDEESHVKFGVEWYGELCKGEGEDKRKCYLEFLQKFGMSLNGLNEAGRKELGFDFYE